MDVVLKLVTVEPLLMQPDPRVAEQREAICAESVRDVRSGEPGEQPEHEGEAVDQQAPDDGQVNRRAARHEARALDVVEALIELGKEAGNFLGTVLTARRHDHDRSAPGFARRVEAMSDGGAYPAVASERQDDRAGGFG